MDNILDKFETWSDCSIYLIDVPLIVEKACIRLNIVLLVNIIIKIIGQNVCLDHF